MADYYTLLTNAGLAYETACKANGVPIKLTKMSVGDGNGAVYNPDATASALKREVWRGDINALLQDSNNPNWLVAELNIPDDVGGWYVREAAIWTDTGVLYAIIKYPESYKPVLATSGAGKEFYIRAIFQTSNASSVTLVIDENVVKATRAWVTDYVARELNKLDFKKSVRVVATAPITLNGAQQIDGVAVIAGDRVLPVAQADARDNSIWIAANGPWQRAADADESIEVTPNLIVAVEEGAQYGDTIWQLVTNGPIVLGTTALTFEMVAGKTGIGAGTYRSLTVDKYGRVIGGTNPKSLAGYGILDAYDKPQVDALIAQASALPLGSIVPFPRSTVPPGFLELNGSTFDASVYPGLATYLGGNVLPDFRGEFLRGWDHGRGVDAGRALGSWQADELKKHRHPQYEYDTGNTDAIPDGSKASDLNANYAIGMEKTALIGYAGGTETRPRNVAVMWCIKAWNAPVNQGTIDVAALASKVDTFQAMFPFRGRATVTAPGVTNWAVPAGVNKVWVRVIGGGGGAGRYEGGGGGGGAGGIAEKLIDLTGVASVTLTVGDGGAGRTGSSGDGSNGGTSSFGSYCSATGGAGASKWYGGQGGVGSGGDINTSIGNGSHQTRQDNGATNTSIYGGGHGGGPGGMGSGSGSKASPGNNATLPGGGGGGGNENGNGGNGAPGSIEIRW